MSDVATTSNLAAVEPVARHELDSGPRIRRTEIARDRASPLSITCPPQGAPATEAPELQEEVIERDESVVADPTLGAREAYRDHFDVVWRTLRRLGVPDSGLEDAVQDVFLTVHRRWHEFHGRSSLRTWVVGIAVRIAANHRRGLGRQLERYAPLRVEHPCGQTQPDELAAHREALETVQLLLERLAPIQRELLVLVDLEQLSVPEAAQALGENTSTCYKRLSAARARFNLELSRYRAKDQWRAR